MSKTVYVQKVNLSGMYVIAFLMMPFVAVWWLTMPLWKPAHYDSQRETPQEELDRARYYDEAGGWVRWFDADEADRRARESYEAVIRTSKQNLSIWVAHSRLGQMDYEEGNFKEAIEEWNQSRSIADSTWQQNTTRQDIWKANCRISGGASDKCLFESLNH